MPRGQTSQFCVIYWRRCEVCLVQIFGAINSSGFRILLQDFRPFRAQRCPQCSGVDLHL